MPVEAARGRLAAVRLRANELALSTRQPRLGLGNIGAPMARRLLDRPDDLVVMDVSAAATEPFAAAGATVAVTPAELAARATVISVVVQNESQVRDVLEAAP